MATLNQTPENGFTHKLLGPVVALYDWLSGAPMSERDHLQRDIAEARPYFPSVPGCS